MLREFLFIIFSIETENHYMRFSENDPKLQPIQAFVDQLNGIKSQYTSDK